MLYDSVKQEVTICQPQASPDAVPSLSGPVLVSSILSLVALTFVPLAGVFGFLWYGASKRQSQESEPK